MGNAPGRGDPGRDVPQGLKPSPAVVLCGTAEAVPFVHQRNSKLVANLILFGQALFKPINKLHRKKGS